MVIAQMRIIRTVIFLWSIKLFADYKNAADVLHEVTALKPCDGSRGKFR